MIMKSLRTIWRYVKFPKVYWFLIADTVVANIHKLFANQISQSVIIQRTESGDVEYFVHDIMVFVRLFIAYITVFYATQIIIHNKTKATIIIFAALQIKDMTDFLFFANQHTIVSDLIVFTVGRIIIIKYVR